MKKLTSFYIIILLAEYLEKARCPLLCRDTPVDCCTTVIGTYGFSRVSPSHTLRYVFLNIYTFFSFFLILCQLLECLSRNHLLYKHIKLQRRFCLVIKETFPTSPEIKFQLFSPQSIPLLPRLCSRRGMLQQNSTATDSHEESTRFESRPCYQIFFNFSRPKRLL